LTDATRAHWKHALDIAAEALEAGRQAKILGPEFCAEALRAIQDERAWLAELAAWS